MPSSSADNIRLLCQEFGIDTEYWDIWGHHHVVEPASLLSILGSFGLDVSSPDSLAESARLRAVRVGSRPLDPVAVLTVVEAKPGVPLRVPSEYLADGQVAMALYWEDGWAERRDFQISSLDTGTSDGLLLPLPAPLRLGYHDLEIVIKAPERPDLRSTQRIIVAPEKAWLPEQLKHGGRAAGLAVSLFGLRSERNWGAGDFTDLANLTDWVARALGAGFVALNPLHAIHNRQPYNTSPYLPLSAFHRNYLYIDVEVVDDFKLCPTALAVFQGPVFQKELAAVRAAEFVEYERVARLKLGLLRLLFRRFLREEWSRNTTRAQVFRKWIAERGDLLDRFATYCALDESLHKQNRDLWIWPDWPEPYRNPESPEVRNYAQTHWRRILFHKYLQWQIDLQLDAVQTRTRRLGMPIGLYHDVALATDRCGCDLWAYRDFFVTGARVGSPPDDFAPEGQDWAFPPPNSETHRENGYRLFVESIRRNARHGGALRIDHVMRFFRLFWIPDGANAAHGTYVNEHWQDLLRILALESVRGRFLIVGEDLGTVPPCLREAMDQFSMLRYKLFYFEKGNDGLPLPPRQYPRSALVSSTTHDLPTIAGFWAGRDIEARRTAGVLNDQELYERQKSERREEKHRMIEALVRDGFLPGNFPREAADWPELTGELHNAVIGYLVTTPSRLMLLNQEDLTKELDQQNLPGTTWQYPNWRRKTIFSVEDLAGSKRAGDYALMFRSWLERTGRISVPSAESPRS
ncbi:4-alpha-glucanotransferase [uncultured Paludibaculum sp.]|uniref:4-alpha-glucanotransferase n=1 Tax=uncultured Paludibaculum sp. TaxID=1765020 RepID=UPI002AAB041A|nr:4-alpha-glucanotransferase [uncultured Paludibaculum sp.]